MKFWISLASAALIGIMAETAAFGVTISLNIETKMFSSEAAATKEAKKVVAEINAGKNAKAIQDAVLECPSENNPTFNVNWVRMNSYLIPSGADFDKRYSTQINYDLRCRSRGSSQHQ